MLALADGPVPIGDVAAVGCACIVGLTGLMAVQSASDITQDCRADAANDDCYDDIDDPCEEWADELIAMRLSIIALRVTQSNIHYSLLVNQFRKLRANFCMNCPHLCDSVRPL